MELLTPTHYAPDGRTPLCCDDCLELVAEDLADNNEHMGRCLNCGQRGW